MKDFNRSTITPQSSGDAPNASGGAARPGGLDRVQRNKLFRAGLFAAVLVAAFIRPLVSLGIHAAGSNLNSYILLVPVISAYLLYLQRNEWPNATSSFVIATGPAALGLAALAWVWHLRTAGLPLSGNDFLSLTTAAFVAFVVAGGFLFLGSKWMATAAFPVGFLIFMIPLPDVAVEFLETMSKLASAEAANFFFNISGVPVLREGVVFQLPGLVIRVAQECSGIHSSLVLFITSLLMSHLLLRTAWRRAVLVAFVIPLGILRNGFRILVIGWLCVHVGPGMIDSPIHHQGGPLFFALSLIPLSLFLWLLRKKEAQNVGKGGVQPMER